MAKATKTTTNEERVIITPVERIILELTAEEAQFLYDIVSWGITGVGRRRMRAAIYDALDKMGLSNEHPNDFSGSLYVKK